MEGGLEERKKRVLRRNGKRQLVEGGRGVRNSGTKGVLLYSG